MSTKFIPDIGVKGSRDNVFPLDSSYIPEYVKKRAKSELSEDEDTVVYSLTLFRSMLRDQADFTWQDDDLFLLAFLRARKFDLKRSFNLMKSFYTGINKYSRVYHNIDFDIVRRTFQTHTAGFLPYRDKEGCLIFVIRVGQWNPLEYNLDDIVRCATISYFLALRSPATQIAGIRCIGDVTGLSLRHVPHISLSHLWHFSQLLQNWCPARFRSCHVVNENFLFRPVWAVLKHLMSRKMKERWHFHGKNFKSLHKYISPSILPAEYEGDLPLFDNTSTLKEAEDNKEYITHVFSFGYHQP